MNQEPVVIGVDKAANDMTIFHIQMPDGSQIKHTTRMAYDEVMDTLRAKLERDRDFNNRMQQQLEKNLSRRFKVVPSATGKRR